MNRWMAFPTARTLGARPFALRTAWTPDLLPGVKLWLDASDASTITITGSGVSSWANKRGSASAAGQSTDASRPTVAAAALNGRSGLLFASQYMNGTVSMPTGAASSLFIVGRLKSDAVSGGRIFAAKDSAADTSAGSLMVRRNSTGEAIQFYCNGAAQVTTSVTYNTAFIYGIVTNASGASVRLNGGTASTVSIVTSFNITRYVVGTNLAGSSTFGASYWSDHGYEIILCNVESADGDRQKLEGYLAHKWGLTGSLPSDHPHKTIAP